MSVFAENSTLEKKVKELIVIIKKLEKRISVLEGKPVKEVEPEEDENCAIS